MSLQHAVARVLSLAATPRNGHAPFVITPNVHHTVTYQTHPGLRAAYADAALVLADGAPLVWMSRLLRQRLPERVAGSAMHADPRTTLALTDSATASTATPRKSLQHSWLAPVDPSVQSAMVMRSA